MTQNKTPAAGYLAWADSWQMGFGMRSQKCKIDQGPLEGRSLGLYLRLDSVVPQWLRSHVLGRPCKCLGDLKGLMLSCQICIEGPWWGPYAGSCRSGC